MSLIISEGGRLLVMLGDGGEKRFQTNINVLLEVVNSILSSFAFEF